MGTVTAKLSRLREAASVVLVHSAGWQSRRQLLRCYADLRRAVTDPTVIDVQLRCGAFQRPCRLRRSDVFTLAEIFHERQYDISSRLPSTPILFDAGANVGLASLWLSGRWPQSTIHAFEPEPQNFELLEHNLRSLGTARANRIALGDFDGETNLTLSSHGAMHSTSSAEGGQPGLRVPAMRMDTYLELHGIAGIDLLKLDVEGAELRVLEGLGRRVRDVAVIVGEVHERVVDVDRFYTQLRAGGFTSIRRIPFRSGADDGVHGFEASRP